MKFFMMSLLVGFTNISFAIDYSLCSQYLESETPRTYLKMNEKGEIGAIDQKQISHYEEAKEGKNIFLRKSWQNKTTPGVKEYVQVRVSKSENGDITIQHVAGSNTSITWMPARYVSTTVQLKIKNGKCFPAEVNSSPTTLFHGASLPSNVVAKEGVSFTANTQKCREILDFYKNNPASENCSNTDYLKNLKKVLGYSEGTWAVSNELLEEIDDKLTEANKLVEISTNELNKCNNARLTPSVKDEELWLPTNHSHSASSREDGSTTVTTE